LANFIISACVLIAAHATPCYAAEPVGEAMLSYQSFSGIINTPSAHVPAEGSFQALYNNQTNKVGNRVPEWMDNYVFSVGLFSFMELGGRLTSDSKIRDLSANIKLTTAPLTKSNSLIPVLAVGWQDVGGGSNLLESRYVVLSEDIWRFRLSAGYGKGPDQLNGAFGGLELKLHDWVYLLGDYDANETNAGLRLVSPEIGKTPVRLTFSAKTALNSSSNKTDLAFGLAFPLDFQKRSKEASRVVTTHEGAETPTPGEKTPDTTPSRPATGSERHPTDMVPMRDRLLSTGLINIRVGQRGDRELFVEYENSIYNHNELDALGVVAGIIAESAPTGFESASIVIKRKNIRMAEISAPLGSLRSFMASSAEQSDLKERLTINFDAATPQDVSYLPEENGSAFPNTAFILAPGLTTFVGTEVGVFDYLLTLKPEIISDLWKGGVLNARWDIPLSWSDGFDEGQPFYNSRTGSRMDRLMLFQGIKPTADFMANFGGGLLQYKTFGTLNEVMWSPGDGAHRLRGTQAWARSTDTERTREVYLGSYRYFLAPLDLSLELTAGRFWGQDHGYSLEMKRFFGETSVSTYYKNSTTSEGKQWQAAGIQFSFPLTPRKALRAGPIQLRGSDEWSYAQETTLAIGGQRTNDVLTQALGITPQTTPALSRAYYNRDRLSTGYIRQHLEQLREAWLEYKK
jgi:hypothetical protein